MMRFFIRVDASVTIGTGHVMRCLTLSDKLKEIGHQIVFLYDKLPAPLIELIAQKGYSLLALNSQKVIGSLDDALYVSDVLNRAYNNIANDWLIIDHYGIDESWERVLRNSIKNILVIDDQATRKHECSILLNTSLIKDGKRRYSDLVPSESIQLLGPKYALLRDEFYKVRTYIRTVEDRKKDILICFGGSDPTNESCKVLNSLENLLNIDEDISLTVISGSVNPHLDELLVKCHSLNRTKLIIQPPSIAEVMAHSQLAVCAGGTMTAERYCIGLPAVVIAVADNQLDNGRTGEELGIDTFLGKSDSVKAKEIITKVLNKLSNAEMLLQSKIRAMDLVDGKGASRVVELLSSH